MNKWFDPSTHFGLREFRFRLSPSKVFDFVTRDWLRCENFCGESFSKEFLIVFGRFLFDSMQIEQHGHGWVTPDGWVVLLVSNGFERHVSVIESGMSRVYGCQNGANFLRLCILDHESAEPDEGRDSARDFFSAICEANDLRDDMPLNA